MFVHKSYAYKFVSDTGLFFNAIVELVYLNNSNVNDINRNKTEELLDFQTTIKIYNQIIKWSQMFCSGVFRFSKKGRGWQIKSHLCHKRLQVEFMRLSNYPMGITA